MSFNELIRNESLAGMKRLLRTVKKQETLQNNVPMTFYGVTSNPPSTAEINALIDTPANVGTDFVGLIVDAVNARQFLVWTDSINWYTVGSGGSGDYYWPGFVVVDPTGQYPNSYPTINDAVTAGNNLIRLLGSTTENVSISGNRTVLIIGIGSRGLFATGYSRITGNITFSSSASLILYGLTVVGNITSSGSVGSLSISHCEIRNSIINTTSTLTINYSQLTSTTNNTSSLIANGVASFQNSTFIKTMTGTSPMINVQLGGGISYCVFDKSLSNTGPILNITALSLASSYIHYSDFQQSAGAVSIASPVWNPARFYFNRANVAWSANIVPPGTAFNTVG